MKQILIAVLALVWPLMAAGQQTADTFPYPAIPDTLRTPDTRAAYLIEHYWDGFNFADTTLLRRPEMAEQGFANFIDLLPRFAPAAAATGLRQFVDRVYSVADAKVAERVRDYWGGLAYDYLGDSGSPLHNDLLYAQFLDVMSANRYATAAERTRNEYMAHNLRKNLPGAVAADFVYVDRTGASHRLLDFKAAYTILYFYDPDCAHCREVAGELKAMTASAAVGQKCRVLAVYPYSDTEHWREAATDFPDSWTDGYSPDGAVATDDIYYISSAPSVYLLDSDKKVLLKNPSVETLRAALEKMK